MIKQNNLFTSSKILSDFKPIFDHFNSIIPISDKEIEEITPFLKIKILEKDEFLLRSNQICKFMTFIKQGSFRSFHIKLNGESANLMLNSSNEFISDLESLISDSPSNIFIQAIEKCEVIIISKDDLNLLYEKSLYWNKLGRKMTEFIFIISKQRLETLLYKKPKERYIELQQKYPIFFDKYSLTDISSFIGITPQSLSRIRAKK